MSVFKVEYQAGGHGFSKFQVFYKHCFSSRTPFRWWGSLCTISLDHTVCVKFFVKINIIKFVNSAKSSTVDSTTLARIENKKVIIVVANTTPLLTFSIMYLIFFFIVFFIQKLLLRKWMWSQPNEKSIY